MGDGKSQTHGVSSIFFFFLKFPLQGPGLGVEIRTEKKLRKIIREMLYILGAGSTIISYGICATHRRPSVTAPLQHPCYSSVTAPSHLRYSSVTASARAPLQLRCTSVRPPLQLPLQFRCSSVTAPMHLRHSSVTAVTAQLYSSVAPPVQLRYSSRYSSVVQLRYRSVIKLLPAATAPLQLPLQRRYSR